MKGQSAKAQWKRLIETQQKGSGVGGQARPPIPEDTAGYEMKSPPARSSAGIALGEGGFPGTWFIENRSPRVRAQSGGRRIASYMRLLRTLSATVASSHPACRMSGRILVSDLNREGASSSVSVFGQTEVEVNLEIPSEWLFEGPEVQARTLSRMLSRHAPPERQLEMGGSARAGPSPCGSRLVQFVHCGSLLERRERQFSAVPPAAFCMAPALQRKGFEVWVDTLMLEPFTAPGLCPASVREANRERLDRILERRPFCIAFTVMDFYLEELRALIREIRSRDKEVVVALGGPLATLYPEKAPVYLEQGNVFIRGEADLAFSEVLDALAPLPSSRDLSRREIHRLKDQAGLCLQYGDTFYVSKLDQTERIKDIEEVFHGRMDLGFIRKEHVIGGLHLHTTRGCPFQCSFCAKVHGSHVRAMSSATIFRLLSAYRERVEAIGRTEGLSERERRKALQVTFSDDDFLLARPRAESFLSGLKDQPIRLKTVPAGIPSFLSAGETGKRRFDPGLFQAIKAAGRRIGSFEIGTDDFTERELSRLAKGRPGGYSLADIEEVIGRLEELGVPNRHFVILSNPATRWSDLFEKLIALEDLSGTYARFLPDPNPFVLAPVGTPLFREMERQGRADTLTRRTLAVADFPEFTHRVFNMAPPAGDLFSTERLSHLDFFRRLCDLLKSRCRFSIFDDAYLHYLCVCNESDPTRFESEEKERILDQFVRAVHLRIARVSSAIKSERRLSVGSETTRKEGFPASQFSGLLLLRETVGRLFPEEAFLERTDRLEKTLDAFFHAMVAGSDLRAGLPADTCREIDRALCFGRAQIGLYEAAGRPHRPNLMAKGFVRQVEAGLLEMGLRREAEEWRTLSFRGDELVRLEVADDKGDARFVEDEAGIERLFDLLRLADPGSVRAGEGLRFIRAERVIGRSIRDDFLGRSETRVALYDGLADLPVDFLHRFQEEFDVSPFLDKEGFLTVLLSKFLTGREMSHNRALHGTTLFDGLDDVLEALIPRSLKEFSRWLLGRRGEFKS